ncbi:MAG: GAF domain-containing protein [Ardenticatenaceae bacterium]|nr:GAF domain-containing protein [Ardenticatenaceae bacterium]MCB9446432.1 GAF domain-containing protein [Ardenticatenaceae bacterium]
MSTQNPDFFPDLLTELAASAAILDSTFNLIWHNQSFAQFIAQFHPGRPLESLVGASLPTLWPDARRLLEPFLQQLQAGEPVQTETVNIRRGGAETYWDLLVRPYPQSSATLQFILILHDVTDHILAYQGLERQMADRMRKLKALYDVMQVASESLDLNTMVMRALQRVLTAVQAAVGMVHLLDESGEHLHLAGHFGLTEAMQKELTAAPADVGLAGQVLKKKTPVVVTDIRANAYTRPIFRQSGLNAFVGVRMRVKGHSIGVLSAFWERQRPLSPENIELLDSTADQMAAIIESHRLRQKAEQLAVMEERNRLARDLHDSVSQALYSMSLLAVAGRRLAKSGSNPELLDETLAELSLTSQQALKEMRLLLYRLRPLALQLDGLVETLQHRLDAVEKRAGVDARLLAENLPPLLPTVEETLYHIAQEALNNALKHADATAVTVQIAQEPDGAVRLVVTDNGRGFDPDAAMFQGGMGLANMRQRAESRGGTLEIVSSPGQGCTVTVRLYPGNFVDVIYQHE